MGSIKVERTFDLNSDSKQRQKKERKQERIEAMHLLILLLWLTAAASAASQALPGCPEKCGDISIPYPFGIEDGCYREENGFRFKCDYSFSPPKPFIGDGNVEVLEASLELVRTRNWIAHRCYNESGGEFSSEYASIDLSVSVYTFSDTRNKFTVLGCDKFTMSGGSEDLNLNFTSGCTPLCPRLQSMINGSCNGVGCCQTAIPKGIKRFDVFFTSQNDDLQTWAFNHCNSAFLAEDHFQFSVTDLTDLDFANRSHYHVPVALDWRVGNETCEEALSRDSMSFACRENSYCINSTNGPGYRCNCSRGYKGNPYLTEGCQDINECEDQHANNCQGTCINTEGGYKCSCPEGTHVDDRDGHSCIPENKPFPVITVTTGVCLGLLFLLIGSSWLYWGLKKRKLILLKEKFFKQNGGLLLQQQISHRQGAAETSKIFTAEELEKATNKYHHSQILGKGGYGTVYKGILSDNRVVAIKKSKIVDESQIEQFINEVAILSQINHRNVVKLLGCCLETQVPLLVYEYVSNGTLFHHIHDEGHVSSLSLENRLRIAAETAGALSYLHSAASIPIYHRDVKSTNILLDDNYTAKVSDFGASRLVPVDKAEFTTLVQGTLGYLDPEYLLTSQLTDKSDVYSFGVVLVELLTGKTPLSFERSEEERNLTMYFISSMKENRLFEILEARVVNEGGIQQLLEVAELAERCLRVKGDERPTMKEVASELEGLRRFEQHPWVQQNVEEAERLLGEPSHYSAGDMIVYDSLKSHEILELEMPR